MQTSLIVATLKRLLPVGLNTCAPGEQDLISLAKSRFSQVSEPELEHINKLIYWSIYAQASGGAAIFVASLERHRGRSQRNLEEQSAPAGEGERCFKNLEKLTHSCNFF